jgi:uncharacterized protein with PIN domain
MVDKLGITMTPLNSRCPKCNAVLKHIKKEAVKRRVPKASYEAFNKFWECTKCNAVYWRGSHWVQIKEILDKIMS